jgi:hypothetical protein
VITGKPYPMARLVVSSVDPETGRMSKQLMYVFVIDQRAWSLTHVAPVERFEEFLPLFEGSAASFEPTG